MTSTSRAADVVVIGSGPGGYVAAIRLAQLGRKTLCIEREAIGGVCLNWGCIPSKAMISASTLVEHIQHAGTMGVSVQGVSVDMAKMKLWKDGIVKRLTGGIGELFKRNGVEHLYGDASFLSAGSLRVKTKDGEVTVSCKQVLIATGARPVELPGLKPDGQRIVTSKEALDFTAPPKELLVVGGGHRRLRDRHLSLQARQPGHDRRAGAEHPAGHGPRPREGRRARPAQARRPRAEQQQGRGTSSTPATA